MKLIALSAAGVLLLSAAAFATPSQNPMPHRGSAARITAPLPAAVPAPAAPSSQHVAAVEHWRAPIYNWMYPGRHQPGS